MNQKKRVLEDLAWIIKKIEQEDLLSFLFKQERCGYDGIKQYECLLQKYNCVYEKYKK